MSLRIIRTIAMKEIQTYFASPIAYVIATVFLTASGLSFALSLSSRFPEASIRGFLFGPIFFGLTGAFMFVILLAPLLTMRLLAEEQKMGTAELLLTSPIRDEEVVIGKFLGSLVILAGMYVLTIYFPATLFLFGDPDLMPILTGYLAMFLLGGTALAAGLLGSSLTSNQMVAAVISLAFLLLLWLIDIVATLGQSDALWVTVADFLSLRSHVRDLAFGILDLRDIVYYFSLIGLFLFLAIRVVEMRRWR